MIRPANKAARIYIVEFRVRAARSLRLLKLEKRRQRKAQSTNCADRQEIVAIQWVSGAP